MQAKRGTFEFLRAELTRYGEAAVTTYPVSLREVAETKVATIVRDVDQQALVATMINSQSEIWRHLNASGAEPASESWWIFHGAVTPDSEAPVEVCVPFTGTVDPAGPITIRIEPAHTEAFCTVTRDECIFPRIMVAYHAVATWVRQAGMIELGAPREVYFADCETATGDDPYAHVAQPVGK